MKLSLGSRIDELILGIAILLLLIDFLLLGISSRLITGNKRQRNENYSFRCAGSIVDDAKGNMFYFSGSLSLVGINHDEIFLGMTLFSYHKRLVGISSIQVSNLLVWNRVRVEMKSGDVLKVYCDSKEAKMLKKFALT